jgi:FkbM family methyltransferase
MLKVFLFRFGFLKELCCDFKNYGKIEFRKQDINTGVFQFFIYSYKESLDKDKIELLKSIMSQREEKIICCNDLKFLNLNLHLFLEAFILEEHNLEKISPDEEKWVIDIGANIGDTTIYFASKGYNVISFEPVKKLFEIAKENINLNKELKERVKLVQKAVGSKNGKMKIFLADDSDLSGGSSSLINTDEFEIVDVISMEKLLKQYNISSYILKIDCEGCEADFILNTDLSQCEKIIFEYHTFNTNISHKTLIKKLEEQNFELINIQSQKSLQNFLGLVEMDKK